MFKDKKYSVISITHITCFFRILLLSTSNVRMSEGTFGRVEVQMCRIAVTAISALNLLHSKTTDLSQSSASESVCYEMTRTTRKQFFYTFEKK